MANAVIISVKGNGYTVQVTREYRGQIATPSEAHVAKDLDEVKDMLAQKLVRPWALDQEGEISN